MQLLRGFKILSLVGFALAACAHSADSPPPATPSDVAVATPPSPDEDEASLSLREHHRHHHHGGITTFIAMSLDTLGADPAKETQIRKIQADLNQHLAPAREAEKMLVTTLADGVSAGSIDAAKVNATILQLSSAASAAHDATVNALNQLHAILSPAERASLVDKVRAHWEVWQKVNHQAEPGGRETGGRLARLTEELSLTPDQVDKISSALRSAMSAANTKFDPKEADAQVQAFTTAFASDSFDAKSLKSAAGANGRLATHGASRMVTFYETVSPLLTPDQRTKLAQNLHEHLNYQQVNAVN